MLMLEMMLTINDDEADVNVHDIVILLASIWTNFKNN